MWILLCYISGSWSFLLQGNYLPQQDLVPLHLSSSLVVGLNVSATPSKVYLWIWFAGFWDSHAKVSECFSHFIWVLILLHFVHFCCCCLAFKIGSFVLCFIVSFLSPFWIIYYIMDSSPVVHCILNLHFSNDHIWVLLHLTTAYQIYIFIFIFVSFLLRGDLETGSYPFVLTTLTNLMKAFYFSLLGGVFCYLVSVSCSFQLLLIIFLIIHVSHRSVFSAFAVLSLCWRFRGSFLSPILCMNYVFFNSLLQIQSTLIETWGF